MSHAIKNPLFHLQARQAFPWNEWLIDAEPAIWIIRYNLTLPAPNRVTFESDGTQPGPRYHLSYWLNRRALDGKLEVTPPGTAYKAYVSWTSKKD